jgi:hypothetical protein
LQMRASLAVSVPKIYLQRSELLETAENPLQCQMIGHGGMPPSFFSYKNTLCTSPPLSLVHRPVMQFCITIKFEAMTVP